MFFAQAVGILNEIEGLTGKSISEGPIKAKSERSVLASEITAALERISRTARLIEKNNRYFAGKFLMPDTRRTDQFGSVARQFLYLQPTRAA